MVDGAGVGEDGNATVTALTFAPSELLLLPELLLLVMVALTAAGGAVVGFMWSPQRASASASSPAFEGGDRDRDQREGTKRREVSITNGFFDAMHT